VNNRHAATASRCLVAAVFVALALRQLRFVAAHAVNVLYMDQWDFYEPLFKGQGWWATFARQHGPHREGLGLVVTRILAGLSGWDSRWDSMAVSVLVIVAAALAVLLGRCFGLTGRSAAILVGVPLIFFNVHQYELFVGAANLSYGAMPMALLMAHCLCWFVTDTRWRLALLSVLTFLLIFTGFGLFAGVLTPPLLAAEAFQAWRARDRAHAALALAALAGTGVSWALFLHGYTFQPAVAGFRFPYERPVGYLTFSARLLGNFFGAPILSMFELVLGLLVGAALVAIAAWHAWRLAVRGVTREPRSAVLFVLAGFTLLFCANCAIGRVFTGPYAPLAPRYVTLVIPAALAILLQVAVQRDRRAFAGMGILFAVLLLAGTTVSPAHEIVGANWYTDGRRAWMAAYLESHDEAEATRVAQFPIYPGLVGERLDFLERRRLNLFLPGGSR
jgi:hypothetical protein